MPRRLDLTNQTVRAIAPSPPKAGYSKRSRLDKLGVRPDMRVALVGLDDPPFLRELRARTKAIDTGRPKRGTEMILFAIESTTPLARLAALREAIAPDGAIWVLWPKGQKHITEGIIRAAALRQGLVDTKGWRSRTFGAGSSS